MVSLFALANAGILLGGGIGGGFGLGYGGNEITTGGIGYGGGYGSHAVDYWVSIFMIDKHKITIVLVSVLVAVDFFRLPQNMNINMELQTIILVI